MAAEVAPPAPAPVDAAREVVRNAEALCDHGIGALRDAALAVAAAGLLACDPRDAVMRTVALDGDALIVDGAPYALTPRSRIFVLGAGKASLAIAAALNDVAGARIAGGCVAVPAHDGGDGATRAPRIGAGDGAARARDARALEAGAIEVAAADHPLPSARSERAARALLALAAAAGPDDLVVACFTGGSSALASLPPAGVTSAEKRALHRTLLRSGMAIVEVNIVRKHVSAIKGGRLAAAAAPARLVNLTVSDVAGDHLDTITDPSVPDSSTAADAIAVLRAYGLWDEVAPSIRAHLQGTAADSPVLRGEIQSVLLATGTAACDAMAGEARRRGYEPVVLSRSLEGEARELGAMLAALARESHDGGVPFAPPCALLGCGGEATVTLPAGECFGAGGPNQEAALAAALGFAGTPARRVAAAFLDTDGADGSTAVAGAIVDGLSAMRAREAAIDLREALRAHRSRAAIEALHDAVITGPTGTNVNDLFAIVVGDQSAPEGGPR